MSTVTDTTTTATDTTTTAPTESFKDLFEAQYREQLFEQGALIKATVTKIYSDYLYLDAGTKSECPVPTTHFKDGEGNIAVAVGDIVDVMLEMAVDGHGETRLSRDKAIRMQTWQELGRIQEADETVEGTVVTRVRGGLNLDINGIRAFLPRSLIDMHEINNWEAMVGTPLEVKVIKLDEDRNNAVVSRRAVSDISNQAKRQELMDRIQEGDVMEGVVKNMTDYGAFVDLGGMDGLLHITDMAWRRVHHPSEMVEVGQTVKVHIMKFDRERERLSLGMKQFEADPWENLEERLSVGTIVKSAKVTSLADYGAFVHLEDSIDGLVHTSEFDWKNRNVHPKKLLTIGQEVDVKIIGIDKERRRISLSIKQCSENPLEAFANTYKRGDRITGTINSKTDFGLFVGLPGDIDGLVHVSDLAWEGQPEQLLAQYEKGDTLEVMLLSMDVERCRISLGVKQLSEDTFMQFAESHKKGVLVEGVVVALDDKGADVEVAPGVIANLRQKEMDDGNYAVGDKVEAVITMITKKTRSVHISVKNRAEAETQSAIDAYKASSQDDKAQHTLGALFSDALSSGNSGNAEDTAAGAQPSHAASSDASAADEEMPSDKA